MWDDAWQKRHASARSKAGGYQSMLTICKSGVAIAWLIGSAVMARAQTPTIVSAIVNSATKQITITGTSLTATGAPVVKLDAATLTLASSSSTQIVANLPAGLAAGTYRMTVNNGSGTTGIFDVTNGAVGPQGPTGATGPAGPQGPSGSLTLPFIGSASGSSDPVFQITNTSPAHSAISGHGGGGSPGDNGGTGTSGYGGASAGTAETAYAGDGVYALGGTAGGGNDIAGSGISAYGGPANGTYADGGRGVNASGGNGGYVGGDGVYAAGGNGGYAGDGIFAFPGSGAEAYAGDFYGDVDVSGTLSKTGGSFKIDHPLDPANKYLYHSFVESPDMKNIYDGTVVTDGSGAAIVTMPSWFEALNTDFRYQLTVIGQFAQAIVAAEIVNRSFIIKTSKPGVKVSWQVTGVRHDAWANAHRIP